MRACFALLVAAGCAVAGVRPGEEQRAKILEAFFVPRPLPPLAAEVHGRFEVEPGVTAERVTYATQFGLRVPAILYLPRERAGKVPALVVVNGHGGDKYSWYAFYTGVLYARAGAAVLTYDPGGEGERNAQRRSGTRAHDRIQGPPELARRLCGLMVTDLLQAVSYLASRPEVDAERIAAAGYSLGSFVVAIGGAVDLRIRACVPVGGGNLDGPGEYWDRSKPMCTGRPYQALSFLGDRAAVLYGLHAHRGATLVYNGLADTVVGITPHADVFFQGLQARVRASGAPRVFEVGLEPGVSHRPFFVTRPVAAWLEEQLDFPRWSRESIAAMPTTHVGTWARERGVELDRLYATEEREAGTPALDRGVPGLGRLELSVFSPEEWERRKGELILESWLARAQAASDPR